MKTYAFTIIASGLDPEASDFADRFFEAGCDDATLSFQRGRIRLDFAREAKNFAHAVVSAVMNVASTGARIERIEPDPLVSMSEIAARSGLTRAAISQFVAGERRQHFPAPVLRVTTESPLWAWLQVARWLHKNHKLPSAAVVEASLVSAVNYVASYRPDDLMKAPAAALWQARNVGRA